MRIAVRLASMSARFCSTGPPFIPEPTMLMKDEDAGFRAVDDLLFELQEVTPSSAAGVDECRLAAPERMVVGRNGRVGVAQVCVFLRAEEDMRMDVDEARNDVEARRIHDAPGERGIDLRANARDLGPGHRHVHHGVEAVAWIDHMAVG